MPFFVRKITYRKRSYWLTVHSCNCDGKSATNSQLTFISGSNFDSLLPIRQTSYEMQEVEDEY
jgi:hypothetical protein